MRNKLLTFAGGVVVLAILGHFYAKPLLAQVRAALVKNVDEPGRNPYKAIFSCSGTSSCAAQGPLVPAGQRLVVEHMNLYIVTTQGLALNPVILTDGAIFSRYPANFFQNRDPFDFYLFDAPILAFFEPNSNPQVTVAGSGSFTSAECVLTGYLVNLNN